MISIYVDMKKARKQYKCGKCGKKIKKGEQYYYITVYNSGWHCATKHYCKKCYNIPPEFLPTKPVLIRLDTLADFYKFVKENVEPRLKLRIKIIEERIERGESRLESLKKLLCDAESWSEQEEIESKIKKVSEDVQFLEGYIEGLREARMIFNDILAELEKKVKA